VRRVLALLPFLLLPARAEPAQALAHLKDGRVLYGRALRGRTLDTDFGPLVLPKEALAGRGTAPPPPPPPEVRTLKTRWLEIECDLSPERAQLYADQLDAFFDWMLKVYALDVDRVRRDAPYGMRVFRRREDFKRLQREIAPDMAKKGQAFAEGVAGFYSPGHGRIFLWDVEGAYGGFHLEVAKHETTHLLNDLMARQLALALPTWFEEGAATYFSMFVAGTGPEPEDHPGAYATVLGDLDAGRPYRSRDLRSVKWEAFLGREYAWGWAQVRFFRHHAGGRRWPELLDYLRTISGGPVTDSEERRFLKAAGFKASDALDARWHQELRDDKPQAERQYVGTSPEVLAKVEAIAKPSEAMARDFARIGISLARVRESGPAIVYLRAALRGGVADPEVPFQLARALAHAAQRPEDEAWPEEAVAALRRASELAPLRSAYRLALGRQILAGGDAAGARAMLGLALLLCGPDDDDLAAAVALVQAATACEPERAVEETVAALADAAPPATAVLRRALAYHLQQAEEWDELAALLQRRREAGTATPEELGMLAGLFRATDEVEEALALYTELLGTGPDGLRWWPDRIDCLARLGRRAEAKAALAEARAALRGAPPEYGWVRRRLDRLRLD